MGVEYVTREEEVALVLFEDEAVIADDDLATYSVAARIALSLDELLFSLLLSFFR